ncbi:MAG: NERD domain-containing protein [Clostridiales bacterium]|nr:NERD domain-containing protein [Clostridiales bacterium]
MNESLKSLLICLATLAATLTIIVTAFYIVIRRKTSKKRKQVEGYGRESEQRVDTLLKKEFGESAVMTGIYLPYINLDYEKHAEIDHVVINRSGVFVIEVKSHNGFIKNPNEHDWWQTYNDKKIRFYNPLRQNNTHVKIIQNILKSKGQYNVPLYNVVVFTSNRVTFSHAYDNLVKTNELVGYIKRVGKKNALSTQQTARVRSILASFAKSDASVARKHKNAMRKFNNK